MKTWLWMAAVLVLAGCAGSGSGGGGGASPAPVESKPRMLCGSGWQASSPREAAAQAARARLACGILEETLDFLD